MQLALKIDVDTYRGTREGVPRLVEALRATARGATFLFSLGPDHTGRAIRRVFRPGFFGKVSRTSVLEHYGLKTLLYGTLLPGPDIGRRCVRRCARCAMRASRSASTPRTTSRGRTASRRPMPNGRGSRCSVRAPRFTEIFGEAARTHGAAGWQMNAHALRLTQRLGFDYCSDTRGTQPFLPIRNAEPIACPQLPTTLPTLDELIGLDGVTPDNVADQVLEASRDPLPSGHVYTLHAELEGGKLLPAFERLLEGWKAMGYSLVPTRAIYEALDRSRLPRCAVGVGTVAGRSGTLSIQSHPFPA